MIFIHHRRNAIEQLQETPSEWGIEMDVRTRGGELIIHHDAFACECLFDDWLEHYHHRFLILNVKEEGLEHALLDRMRAKGIEDFAFLDQSIPFMRKTAVVEGESRCMVRYSEYEPIELAMNFAGRIDWVWVDTFTELTLTKDEETRLREAGFKLCLVSDELQGRLDDSAIEATFKVMQERGLEFDAICTKRPERWLELNPDWAPTTTAAAPGGS